MEVIADLDLEPETEMDNSLEIVEMVNIIINI